MPNRPQLPDGYDRPEAVGDWQYDPESGKNGHVWTSDEDVTVGVFNSVNRVRVAVFDDRVDGFENNVEPYSEPVPEDCPRSDVADRVAAGVDAAIDWMEQQAPGEWEHPAVVEAVFDPPAGCVLDRYYLESREHIVYYRQEGTESDVKVAGGRRLESDPSLDTRRYLYVQAWRGSGNATVALAPWLRAHDHEMHEVLEPPEECGLEVAVMLAREWVAEQRGEQLDPAASAGQASLEGWSG